MLHTLRGHGFDCLFTLVSIKMEHTHAAPPSVHQCLYHTVYAHTVAAVIRVNPRTTRINVSYKALHITIGWSDLALFAIKTYTLLSIRYIFRSSIPKNWQLQPHAWQSFHFKIIIWTLQINTFNTVPFYYCKEQSPR